MFNFGGNTGLTYEDIQRQRAIAERLRAANVQTPQNVGEGLAAIGRALGARRRERRADETETQGRQAFTEQLSSTFAPPQSYTGNATAEAIKAGLIQRGLPEHVAQGFVMNMMDESGLDPNINEVSPLVPGSRGGFGLYQLTGPRRVAYENYAAQRGVDLGNVDAQLDFLMTELQGPEASAFRNIMATSDPNSAAVAIARDFLRPSQENLDRRIAQYQGGGQSQASTQQILELMSNPYATDAQRMYLGEMLQRSMPKTREQQLQNLLLEAQIAAAQTPKDTRPARQKEYDWLVGMGMTREEAMIESGDKPLVDMGGPQTAGWEKIDENFAEEWTAWTQSGGSDMGRQIAQLQNVLDQLDAGQEITGPAFGLQPDILQAFLSPDALDAREQVEEVVQRNLRLILGAQFTENEGNRLIARAYNQKLDPKRNAVRLRALIQQMQAAFEAKNAMVEYFTRKGTLQGFKASDYIPTLADFHATFDRLDVSQGIGDEKTDKDETDDEFIDRMMGQ